MGKSWRLGRVLGIDVFLHPTFLIFLLYIGAFQGGLVAVAFVASAFACVLLHEFGHALAARRFGIGTVDITLYPIGGVARLERMPREPGIEILVALAGPLVNFAIVGILWGLSGLFARLGPNFLDFTRMLILVNLGLALFNLIPAFPMDGGRVMRALLSGWLGRVRATAIAANIGRALALVFGVYAIKEGESLRAILAIFIFIVAGRELAQVRAEESDQDTWPQPPSGFRWRSRGDGTYGLTPIRISTQERRPYR